MRKKISNNFSMAVEPIEDSENDIALSTYSADRVMKRPA